MIALWRLSFTSEEIMPNLYRVARGGAFLVVLITTGACSSTGGLGSVLGGVLGGNQGSQVSGTVQGVNTRVQTVSIQQPNGQTVSLTYDNQTQVVYQNQNYSVNSLEYGDEVTARVVNNGNSSYYTDLIQVNRSVSTSNNGNNNLQTIQGNVRQVDQVNGWFTLNVGNNGVVTVNMPYNPSRADLNKFQNLRSGDYVRLYGTWLNNSRVELRQFY